jgi:hypothetical protein
VDAQDEVSRYGRITWNQWRDIDLRSRLDFASAGTDATAQISLLPWPRTTIFLADAAAIKVRDTPPRIGLDV